MRYRHEMRLDCGDVGRRVTVRVRTGDGLLSDTVGTLEECDERAFVIRTKRGEPVRLDRGLVVAAKVIPDRPSPAG